MLTLEECKKYLNNDNYSDKEIYEIRKNLYQLGEMLFDEFMENKNSKIKKLKVDYKSESDKI